MTLEKGEIPFKEKPQKILPYGRRAFLLPGISPRSISASECAIQYTLVKFSAHLFHNLNWVHTCDTI
jgi:hypothetical protein